MDIIAVELRGSPKHMRLYGKGYSFSTGLKLDISASLSLQNTRTRKQSNNQLLSHMS